MRHGALSRTTAEMKTPRELSRLLPVQTAFVAMIWRDSHDTCASLKARAQVVSLRLCLWLNRRMV